MKLGIVTDEISLNAKPGQFIMVYLPSGELLLPRPISICETTSDYMEIVYAVVGKGTELLSLIHKGQTIKVLGPLGTSFNYDNYKRVALVGGGVGIPPLLFTAKVLALNGITTDAYLGFRSDAFLVERFTSTANAVFVTTEDGSFGTRGLITDIFQSQNYDAIMACGPLPLLKVLAKKAENIPCQVSMEQRMACGIGTCVGCVVKVNGSYVRVCTEGPVFFANQVFMDS